MREIVIDLARMDGAALAYEFQQKLCAPALRDRPSRAMPRIDEFAVVPRGSSRARMHQRRNLAGYEAVVDEKILLDAELRVASLEVARAIADNAMAQCQILRASGRADRIGLHEAKPMHRPLQRGRLEQAACNRVAAQVADGNRHHTRLSHR